jgi:hypothetical protein
MRHDAQLRATAQAIFDACYPSDDWSPVRFDEAERFGTVHYRQAVDAARRARSTLADAAMNQLELI